MSGFTLSIWPLIFIVKKHYNFCHEGNHMNMTRVIDQGQADVFVRNRRFQTERHCPIHNPIYDRMYDANFE